MLFLMSTVPLHFLALLKGGLDFSRISNSSSVAMSRFCLKWKRILNLYAYFFISPPSSCCYACFLYTIVLYTFLSALAAVMSAML